MKKIIVAILLLIPFHVCALSAKNIVVMDLDSGRVLYENNKDNKHLIASTTKIMTALLAIEYGDLDTTYVVGDEILKSFGSSIYLEQNEEITLKDLLYGLMLRSGNDAAIVIAKNIAGNMEEFVSLMNKKATELGMNNTLFINSHGLEDEKGNGNMSTSYDMALLTKYAMQNPIYQEIVSTKNYKAITNYKTYMWPNKNKLLNNYQYITGGKTGYTEKAKRTLVTTASKDDKNIIVVTLDDPNDFSDHQDIYEEYFNKYNKYILIDPNNFSVKGNDVNCYVNTLYSVLLTDKEYKNIKIEYIMDNNYEAKDNDAIGTVKVTLNKEVLFEETIFKGAKMEAMVRKTNNVFNKLFSWIKIW